MAKNGLLNYLNTEAVFIATLFSIIDHECHQRRHFYRVYYITKHNIVSRGVNADIFHDILLRRGELLCGRVRVQLHGGGGSTGGPHPGLSLCQQLGIQCEAPKVLNV
jgi:hypothetical protein